MDKGVNMTQEELDALMAGDIESMDEQEEQKTSDEDSGKDEVEEHTYSIAEDDGVYPPPATEEHKVVYQLDDVTRDSEKKASEIFDALDAVMANIDEILQSIDLLKEKNGNIKEIFIKLHEKFPNIKSFENALQDLSIAEEEQNKINDLLEESNDTILNAMDIMQYQDIHRQKIERVINIMRALSKYMSLLFEGKVDDESRVKSAKHIEGDSTQDVVGNDDIEALIAQFGGKL